LSTSQLRLLIYYYCTTEVGYDPFGQFETNLFVGLLASAVENRNLYLVSGSQKLGDFTHLDFQIVLADLQAKTHLFEFGGLGSLAVFLQLLGTLVIILTPVDDFADWRIGVGRDLDQIQIPLLRDGQGFLFAQDAELFAILVNDAKLGCPNLIIQAGVLGYNLSPTLRYWF
jgi:hypothetical protein